MGRVFVIPDIHLKPWIFDNAEIILDKEKCDEIVFLGDLVDDWGCQSNIPLYDKTFDRAERFIKDHPRIKWCYGNHDVSYLWNKYESGFSWLAQETVVRRMHRLEEILKDNIAFIHKIDKTIFSHAGLTKSFVSKIIKDETDFNRYGEIEKLIRKINGMSSFFMWDDDSPIWARPQYNGLQELFGICYFQVVGHTPVKETLFEGSLLTVDNFSTYPDGKPIGNESFIIIDSTTTKFMEFRSPNVGSVKS